MIPHRPQSAADRRGATTLEFLIYIAVIAVVLTTATLFQTELLRSQAKSAAIAEAVRNARFALSRMEIEVREASDVNTGSSVFGTNPGTLSLATAAGATDPTIFTVASGALMVQQGTGSPIALTNSKVTVTEFQVDNVGTTGRTRALRLHLKVIARNTGALVEQTAETTVESTVRIHAKDGFSN